MGINRYICQNFSFNISMVTIFQRSILAGISIGLGGLIFVKQGGVVGAVMFAFGLLTVLYYKLPLYTGTAGFVNPKVGREWVNMVVILLGNILGCWLLSLIVPKEVNAEAIIQSRIDTGYLQSFLNAIGCGVIMTLVVKAGREKNYLLTIFGIPLFILCGFYHSIADAFYMCIVTPALLPSYLLIYLFIVLGNFVGCNVPRLFRYSE